MSVDNYDCAPVIQYRHHIYQTVDGIDPAIHQAQGELY
jgi:hypothetical protein